MYDHGEDHEDYGKNVWSLQLAFIIGWVMVDCILGLESAWSRHLSELSQQQIVS